MHDLVPLLSVMGRSRSELLSYWGASNSGWDGVVSPWPRSEPEIPTNSLVDKVTI